MLASLVQTGLNEGVPRQNQKRKIMLGRRATGYLPVGASHWRKRHPPHASRKIISSYFPFLKTTFLQKQSPFYSVSKSLFQKISFLPIQKTGRGIVTFTVPDENDSWHRAIHCPAQKTDRGIVTFAVPDEKRAGNRFSKRPSFTVPALRLVR